LSGRKDLSVTYMLYTEETTKSNFNLTEEVGVSKKSSSEHLHIMHEKISQDFDKAYLK